MDSVGEDVLALDDSYSKLTVKGNDSVSSFTVEDLR
jgi:hypothetical protein